MGGGEGHILGTGVQDDVSGAWEQQQAGGFWGVRLLEVQPREGWRFFPCKTTPKRDSVHVLSAMEISLG